MNKKKELEQEGIIVHKANSGKPRVCPSCHNKLRINVNNLRIYCSSCGYIEPCHLRRLTIDKVNCSSCPYSPIYNDSLVLKAQKIKLLKTLRKPKASNFVLPLGAVVKLTQQNLAYSKLKSKCPQSWNPQSTKGFTFRKIEIGEE